MTEEVNETVFSANDDKRIKSIDSITTFVYGTSKDLKCLKKKLNITI